VSLDRSFLDWAGTLPFIRRWADTLSLGLISTLADKNVLQKILKSVATAKKGKANAKRPRIKSRYRKLVRNNHGIREITPQATLLINHISNSLRKGSFRFSLPALRILAKKENSGNLPSLAVARQKIAIRDQDFLDHFRIIGGCKPKDYLVQKRILQIIEKRVDPLFSENSHAYRIDRLKFGCPQAVVELERLRPAHPYIVKIDIRKFFDEIDHRILMRRVKRILWRAGFSFFQRIELAGLISDYLTTAPRMKGHHQPPWNKRGISQGGPLSNMLSNIYLDDFDRAMARHRIPFIRYADDILFACKSGEQAKRFMSLAQKQLAKLGLFSDPAKTVIKSFSEGFDYLGFHLKDGDKIIRDSTVRKFKKSIRQITNSNRTKSRSPEPVRFTRMIKEINIKLGFIPLGKPEKGKRRHHRFFPKRSWIRFFALAKDGSAMRGQLAKLDYFIRDRLRHVLEIQRPNMHGYFGNRRNLLRSIRILRRNGLHSLVEAYDRFSRVTDGASGNKK
jgi:retron-type reverse transcriptase